MFKRQSTVAFFVVIFFFATLQFVRFYVTDTPFYLHLSAYLAGHERLPFQARILPALVIKFFNGTRLSHYTLTHDKGAFTPERAPLFLISFVAILIAGVYTQKLYRSVSSTRSLSFLVYPVFLFCMMWTYSIHLEANFSYPYDMLAVAFFSAGLYFIYNRRFWPLVTVIVLGTFNRETTLLLLPIYLLDASAVTASGEKVRQPDSQFSLSRLPWLRTALLLGVWLAIRMFLLHVFAHNDRSEDYVRVKENLGLLTPRLWPALLNVCGYVLPLVVLSRRRIQSERFRRYLWVLPLWFAIMFYKGVIVETRIYGELCPYAAVAAVLIIEEHIARAYRSRSAEASLAPQLS